MVAWGPIIAGGLNLAGGLANMFGGGSSAEGGGTKKAKHHQLDYDRRRIKAIVDGAKDAGIHPLAALGATSGAGGFAAPVGNYGGSTIGDAIGAGADAFTQLYESDQDRLERAEDRAYNESMRRRQDAIDTLRSKEMTPERKLQMKNMELQNQGLELENAVSRSKLAALRRGAMGGAVGGHTLVDPLGIRMDTKPGRSSAQEMQDEYGDLVENVYGIGNWIQDMWSARNPDWWTNLWKRGNVPPASAGVLKRRYSRVGQ